MTDARPGTIVRYHAAEDPEVWRTGTLVKASPNGEEWLVKGVFGSYWLAVSRLFVVEPAES